MRAANLEFLKVPMFPQPKLLVLIKYLVKRGFVLWNPPNLIFFRKDAQVVKRSLTYASCKHKLCLYITITILSYETKQKWVFFWKFVASLFITHCLQSLIHTLFFPFLKGFIISLCMLYNYVIPSLRTLNGAVAALLVKA